MHENVMHIYKKYKKWNQSYYPACLESVQEGKGEIRYQFRQFLFSMLESCQELCLDQEEVWLGMNRFCQFWLFIQNIFGDS